ncbi:hypothetical protein S83_002760 [Arachis hypogaea]
MREDTRVIGENHGNRAFSFNTLGYSFQLAPSFFFSSPRSIAAYFLHRLYPITQAVSPSSLLNRWCRFSFTK